MPGAIDLDDISARPAAGHLGCGLRQEQIAPQGSEVHVLRKEPFLALIRIHSEQMETPEQ